MTDSLFLALLASLLLLAYAALRGRGTLADWWVGLLCGLAAVGALGAAAAARDSGFMSAMLGFAAFGTAMSLREIMRRVRLATVK